MNDRGPTFGLTVSSDSYRHARRRWVPKGVALLLVLFVIGLLSACQHAGYNVAVAAIVVPAAQPVSPSCFTRSTVANAGFEAIEPYGQLPVAASHDQRLFMF